MFILLPQEIPHEDNKCVLYCIVLYVTYSGRCCCRPVWSAKACVNWRWTLWLLTFSTEEKSQVSGVIHLIFLSLLLVLWDFVVGRVYVVSVLAYFEALVFRTVIVSKAGSLEFTTGNLCNRTSDTVSQIVADKNVRQNVSFVLGI